MIPAISNERSERARGDSFFIQRKMRNFQDIKICIVGAGFFGSVIAERISRDLSLPVTVIEKRNHIGGNSYSEVDPNTGIECHLYGSHIFHTSNKRVWDYINQFSEFNNYRHVVWTKVIGKAYTMPINLGTINSFYNLNLKPEEAKDFIQKEIAREELDADVNFEAKAISLIGRSLYEAFIKGYSEKQWEIDLTKLPSSIITRLPVRYSYNTRYFSDLYEGIPIDGYGAIFQKMLDHELIHVSLNTDFLT